MNRNSALWLLPLLSLIVLAPLPARGEEEDTQPIDVAMATDQHVVFLRLHVNRGGNDFVKQWQSFLEARFRAADADGDGTLDADELKTLGPLVTPLKPNRNQNQDFFVGDEENPGTTQSLISDPPTENRADHRLGPGADCQNFIDFLRAGMNTPVRVEGRVQNSAGSAPLFARLDADHDGQLSAEECGRAYEALLPLDYNSTEVFNRNQLSGGNPNLRRRIAGNQANAQPQNEPKTRLAVKLLSQAGAGMAVAGAGAFGPTSRPSSRTRTSRSPPSPARALLYDDATFSPFDADGDGALDADELAQLIRRPRPHLEMTANIDLQPMGLAATIAHLDPAAAQLDNVAGQSMLLIGDERIEISLGQFSGNNSAQNQIQNIEFRFKQADEDNNEYLDNREAQRYGMGGLMALDADGDGKLYMREISTYINAESEMANHRLVVAIVDYGHGMFEAVDTDHDELLSARELKQLPKRIAQWDRNGDGQLSIEEIPHLYTLQISQEQVRLPRNNGVFGVFNEGGRGRLARNRSAAGAPAGSCRWIATVTAICPGRNFSARGSNSASSTPTAIN